MSTRTSSRAAFEHILGTVLERDDTTPLKRALIQHGYTDIHALTLLSEDVISSLTYDESKGDFEIPILKFENALISTFLDSILYRNVLDNPVGSDWTGITKEEFDSFRIDPNYLAVRRHLSRVSGLANSPNTLTAATLSYTTKQTP
jgi:hypothetical protein